jgi:hypothetical protein
MFVKVEPTGCCERKGMVQVRFSMYLDPGDARYSETYVQTVDVSSPEFLAGYTGKLDKQGNPVNQSAYDTWYDGLPKVWVLRPFHNHFIYVPPETSNDEILQIGAGFLHEAYLKWSQRVVIDIKNKPINFIPDAPVARKLACESKVAEIKSVNLERKI